MTFRPLLAVLLALAPAVAQAQAKPSGPEPRKPAASEPQKGSQESRLEIDWTAPAECVIKPVMTDDEIEQCRRAGEFQSKRAAERAAQMRR